MNTVVNSGDTINRVHLIQQQQVAIGSILYTVLAMVTRDVLVALKQFLNTLLVLLLQPALMLLALGRISELTGVVPASFATVLLPGILSMTLVSVSIQSVAAPLVNEFGYTREIDDRLQAPLPIWLVGVEKVFIGMFKVWICCALYFPLAWLILGPDFFHLTLRSFWLVIAAIILSSLMTSALGLIIGSVAKGSQFYTIVGVLLLPMSILGCIYFPWASLSHIPVLEYITLLNPQTYISETLRGTLTNQDHMNLWGAFGGLSAFSLLFMLLGLRAFIHRCVTY